MPFYMFKGRYTPESLKALVAKPEDREGPVRKLIESVGGKLHYLFFCFGEEDVIAIIEAPDDEAMAAGALIVGASGTMAGGATVKLMTTKEAVKAMKKAGKAAAGYRAVGSK